jgi:hypothetical protein
MIQTELLDRQLAAWFDRSKMQAWNEWKDQTGLVKWDFNWDIAVKSRTRPCMSSLANQECVVLQDEDFHLH